MRIDAALVIFVSKGAVSLPNGLRWSGNPRSACGGVQQMARRMATPSACQAATGRGTISMTN